MSNIQPHQINKRHKLAHQIANPAASENNLAGAFDRLLQNCQKLIIE